MGFQVCQHHSGEGAAGPVSLFYFREGTLLRQLKGPPWGRLVRRLALSVGVGGSGVWRPHFDPFYKVGNDPLGELASGWHLEGVVTQRREQQAGFRFSRNDSGATLPSALTPSSAIQEQVSPQFLFAGRGCRMARVTMFDEYRADLCFEEVDVVTCPERACRQYDPPQQSVRHGTDCGGRFAREMVVKHELNAPERVAGHRGSGEGSRRRARETRGAADPNPAPAPLAAAAVRAPRGGHALRQGGARQPPAHGCACDGGAGLPPEKWLSRLGAAGDAVLHHARPAPLLLRLATLVALRAAGGNGMGSGIVLTMGADLAPANDTSRFLGA